ncbi:unnamed protein product [Cylindrotheca closterium]|uniref:Uncharacterized protein n=1 Tax=Cylindrotheca closterium TaxID=2856 RepID=A0AAD2GD98_9STRA|nr:unnamed protein product [Cylindrotheca closterium]
MPKPNMNQTSIHFDLSEIGLRENYKLNLLTRLGGKVKFYLKVATFCDKIKAHYELAQYFQDYDLKELHKSLVDILNAAFQELPDLFDPTAHFQERHQKLLDTGMRASGFDTFVFVFESILWDTTVDEALITDAVNLLKPLRKVFSSTVHKIEDSSSSHDSKHNGLSVWDLVEQRKQEKIASRRAKLQRSKSKQLQKKLSSTRAKSLMEESSRSVSTEEMTILSADELCEANETDWESAAYQSWNNMML